MFTVLGVLGQSVGTVVFPTLSNLSVQQNALGRGQSGGVALAGEDGAAGVEPARNNFV